VKDDNTKTIRITKDAYKILHAEKKKLSDISKISYSYSDVILTGLVLLDALSEKHRALVLDLLRNFKKARIKSKSEESSIGIEHIFEEATREINDKIFSKLLKDTIAKIIQHLIKSGFPGAAMDILLSNANLFDEQERNQLSFEILAAMAEMDQSKIRKT